MGRMIQQRTTRILTSTFACTAFALGLIAVEPIAGMRDSSDGLFPSASGSLAIASEQSNAPKPRPEPKQQKQPQQQPESKPASPPARKPTPPPASKPDIKRVDPSPTKPSHARQQPRPIDTPPNRASDTPRVQPPSTRSTPTRPPEPRLNEPQSRSQTPSETPMQPLHILRPDLIPDTPPASSSPDRARGESPGLISEPQRTGPSGARTSRVEPQRRVILDPESSMQTSRPALGSGGEAGTELGRVRRDSGVNAAPPAAERSVVRPEDVNTLKRRERVTPTERGVIHTGAAGGQINEPIEIPSLWTLRNPANPPPEVRPPGRRPFHRRNYNHFYEPYYHGYWWPGYDPWWSPHPWWDPYPGWWTYPRWGYYRPWWYSPYPTWVSVSFRYDYRYTGSTVIITSDPPGAEVYIDNVFTGQYTPAVFHHLLPDRYMVSIYSPEYGWEARFMRVHWDSWQDMHFQLRPPIGDGKQSSGISTATRTVNPVATMDDSTPLIPDWDFTFDQEGQEEFHAMDVLEDGSVLLAGNRTEDRQRKGWLLKLDSNGDRLWSYSFDARGYDEFTSLARTSDGGIILAGSSRIDEKSEADAWLVLCNSDGAIRWSRTYGNEQEELAAAVLQSGDGGFFFTGRTRSAEGKDEGWLARLNSEGYTEWSKRYSTEGHAAFHAMQFAGNDNLLLIGKGVQAGSQDQDGWVVRVDLDGNLIDQVFLGGEGGDRLTHLLPESASLMLAGTSHSPATGTNQAWLLHVDDQYTTAWEHRFAYPGMSTVQALSPSGSGYLLAVSQLEQLGSSVRNQAHLVCMDKSGKILWSRKLEGESSGELNSLHEMKDGAILASGWYERKDGNRDGWVMRLRPEALN